MEILIRKLCANGFWCPRCHSMEGIFQMDTVSTKSHSNSGFFECIKCTVNIYVSEFANKTKKTNSSMNRKVMCLDAAQKVKTKIYDKYHMGSFWILYTVH